MTDRLLQRFREELEQATDQIVVVTRNARHWFEAKSFVESVLGPPQRSTGDIWRFADGKAIYFLTENSAGVDIRDPIRPIKGFAGPVLRFGPDACDKFHGICRR